MKTYPAKHGKAVPYSEMADDFTLEGLELPA